MADNLFSQLQQRRAAGPPASGGIPGMPDAGAAPGPLEAGRPTPPGGGPGPATGKDPLSASLESLNMNLQAAIEGAIPMTPQAENEIKVTIRLIASLAQRAQSQAGPAGPGAPGSPAVPGNAVAGVPGPGGP